MAALEAFQQLKAILDKNQLDADPEKTMKALEAVKTCMWNKDLIIQTKIVFYLSQTIKKSKNKQIQEEAAETKKIVQEMQNGVAARTLQASASNADISTEKRNKYRKLFQDTIALTQEFEAAKTAAIRIEEAMFRRFNNMYDEKYRILITELRTKEKNEALKLSERLASGELSADEFVTMDEKDFLTKAQIEEHKALEKAVVDKLSVPKPPEMVSYNFKCRKCGSNKCSYYQMQTRSADEPMTNFITCLNCVNNWRE